MNFRTWGCRLLVVLLIPPVSAAMPFEAGAAPAAAARDGAGPDLAWSAAAYEPAWSWPVSPAPEVVRGFRPPPQRWLAGHRGVDLAAPSGTQVLSPAAGTVVFAGRVVNRPVMTVDVGGGLLTSFEPVDAAASTGDRVAEGELIGVLAESTQGHCAASCLHWGVRLNGEYVNPLRYVTDRRPSVLLPLRKSFASAGSGRRKRFTPVTECGQPPEGLAALRIQQPGRSVRYLILC
ncbi:M23 family metallopeptidase [Arthrobacter gengyunqii]|uniref:M23 family metallopeptidase n=1 Tax=Arthrobacter gengyunqii TaxID=2886940 RepID=A0ABS8GKH1_9MICC|nr:M23 family metallopeptidase [Arthrobacter gengyunqii]MCC3266462.1 M23 family metallopeptidase [Arthrobacter gengyunqii]